MTPIELQSDIHEVILQEDRALVARRLKVGLPEAGAFTLALRDVSAILVDKTAAARVLDVDSPARVCDLQVQRVQRLPREATQEHRDALLAQRVPHQQRCSRLDADRSVLVAELNSARALAAARLEEIAGDVSWGRVDEQAWQADLKAIEDWELELLERLAGLDNELEQERLAMAELEKELHRVAALSARIACDLSIVVECSAACECELWVEYYVPAACWRPAHTAIGLPSGRLNFLSRACVWQNTGEDWDQVRLLFSTQRASLGASPPKLSFDSLRAAKKTSEVKVASRDVVLQDMEMPVDMGAHPKVTTSELPGIDDGGRVLRLEAPGRHTVASDGWPVFIPLDAFETDLQMERILNPEMSLDCLRKSSQVNAGSKPILAGPVEMVSEGGFQGRSEIGYVAPGERFSLNWGPDPMVRCGRTVSKGDDGKEFMSGWIKTENTVELLVSNLGREPLSLKLTERVPVTELKQVEIQVDSKQTTDAREPDQNGFVTWAVDLSARQRRGFKLVYTLKRRKEVVGV